MHQEQQQKMIQLWNIFWIHKWAWKLIDYFNQFFPWVYIQLHVIPTTNMALKKIKKIETKMHQIKNWLRIWFLMGLNVQYSVDKCFEIKTKDDHNYFFNPPWCRKYMSKGRFQMILQLILLLFIAFIVGWSGTSSSPVMIIWKLFLIPLGFLVLMIWWYWFWMSFVPIGCMLNVTTPL